MENVEVTAPGGQLWVVGSLENMSPLILSQTAAWCRAKSAASLRRADQCQARLDAMLAQDARSEAALTAKRPVLKLNGNAEPKGADVRAPSSRRKSKKRVLVPGRLRSKKSKAA